MCNGAYKKYARDRAGGRNVNNSHYATDTVLTAISQNELHKINTVLEERVNMGLSFNNGKTEARAI